VVRWGRGIAEEDEKKKKWEKGALKDCWRGTPTN